MNNIPLVTAREYLTRVKKKSFIIMTLLGPLLISAFYGGIAWISTNDNVGAKEKTVIVNDESGLFKGKFEKTGNVNFEFRDDFNRDSLLNSSADGFIKVNKDVSINDELELSYESQSSLSAKETNAIERAFQTEIEDRRMDQMGLRKSSLDSVKASVSIQELKIDKDGNAKSSSIIINTAIAMVLSLLIYFFIFLYGVQVMRGVIEEKTNRIVELMISSLKPFELMMGKVLGIAAVGLTQLGIWIILTSLLSVVITGIFGIDMAASAPMGAEMPAGADVAGNAKVMNILQALFDLPILKIALLFLFFFLGGYLLYAALFAAIGSAVDSETDTQQFMMPVTLPLVFSFIVSFSVVLNDPNGTLAVWLSIIPFSSPIVMMSRLPFDGVELWQLALSMVSLVLSILGTVWIAGRIYRTGILMYGKKPSYKEIVKWLFYKN